jgi:hypothetical protein
MSLASRFLTYFLMIIRISIMEIYLSDIADDVKLRVCS